ncbi:11944_t:CDS:2 [Acaulospora morrowiae]|uniref:11944_t:CDS:1 n=1 Tax=Acaulospora morrowiae TaxID=94023 RepID=A0A9N9GXA8_9GLOM|nr:11944_t:CDS:2 [Acaulospora morrowiae]
MEQQTTFVSQSALLNIDLLHIIFEYFEYQDDMFNGLLVHSCWTLVLVNKLWKKPSWKSSSVFYKFMRTLRSHNTTFPYASMIQHVNFAISSPHHPEISILPGDVKLISERCNNLKHVKFTRAFSAATISSFLENCPGLTSFSAIGHKQISLSNALSPIREGKCSKLLHLELPDWKHECKNEILRGIGKNCPMLSTFTTSSIVTNTMASTIVASFPNLQSFTCGTTTTAGFTILVSGLPKLKCLSLVFPYISFETAASISQYFPPLESFSLRISSYQGFDHFAKLWVQGEHYLRHLELDSANALSDDSFLPIAKYCQQLESIELKDCTNLTDVSVSALARCRNTSLKRFTILNCDQLTDLGISELSEHCPNLTRVTILGCLNITHISLSKITEKCQGLVEFAFTNRPRMTAAVVMALVRYERRMLEVLNIMSDNLATADITVKPPYPKFDLALVEKLAQTCPSIRSLGLRFNMVGLDSDELINSIHKFQNLELICIGNSNNKLFEREHIKQLETHRRLKEVVFIGGGGMGGDE